MKAYFPGFEPDFDVRQELRFIGGVLDLRQFDKIFISVSGGKDSHAMLFLIREIAEKQGALDRLLAMYADTGMEWHNAESHVRKICAAAGIPLKIVYPIRPMLEKFAHRIKLSRQGLVNEIAFPSKSCRYCTSEQKVAPMNKLIRRWGTMKQPVILLKVTGERWNESEYRSHLTEFCKIGDIATNFRRVYGWRPMLPYTTADVFKMVQDSRVERHICYEMGCNRLGCAGCIFSKDHEIKVEMRENPFIFEAIDRLETDSGKVMSITRKRIRDRVK